MYSYVSISIDITNPALGFGYTREVSLDILYKWVASNFVQLIKINVFHIQFLYEYIYNTLLKKWCNILYYIYSKKKCIIMK